MSETQTAPVDTVTIEIDGVEMEAPKGSMIIEAADKVGIEIPRFCYHKKLSIAANCRMCLVDVEKAPKPLPACATPVMDGMKVYTQSKRALDAQHGIMEFLLINHPLDCPICDQGGECELQDQAMGYGRSVSRFTERKRVVADEDLGSLVATDMTRCIHCTRCVRFLDEIAGTNELGGMGRGETTKIATFIGRSIDSELSGNIIDLCPVGALTNKPFRFRARAWELKSRKTIATHDPLHSNLHTHTRRGEILRTVPRDNEAINEAWLSDRDRYSHTGLAAEDRAGTPMIKQDGVWKFVEWPVALQVAAKELGAQSGSDIGWLLSGRASNEELYLAQKLARAMGSVSIDHRTRQLDLSAQPAPRWESPVETLGSADAIMLVGTHVRHEVPLLGHKVRQAWRNGASIVGLNALSYENHFDMAEDLVAAPSQWLDRLQAMPDQEGSPVAVLKAAAQPVVLVGSLAMRHPQAAAIREACARIAELTGAALCEIPDQPNGIGAIRMGATPGRGPGGHKREDGLNSLAMLEQPQRAYVLYDLEPSVDCAFGAAATQALGQAEAVIYLGGYASEEIRDVADVILPLAVHPEIDGTFTNLEGREQTVAPAARPPGQASAGWKVLRVLANELGLGGFDYTNIGQVRKELQAEIEVAEGQALSAEHPDSRAISFDGEGLERISEVPIYSCDPVVRRAQALQDTKHGAAAIATLNEEDAAQLELHSGDQVRIAGRQGALVIACEVSAQIPKGCVQLPSGVADTSDLGSQDVKLSVEKV